MNKLGKNYKSVILPAGVSLVLVALILVVGNIFIGQITSLREEESAVSAKLATLESRLATLQEAKNTVENLVGVARIALPEDNPSILVTRQLRSIATERGVALSDFSVTPTGALEGETLLNYEVTFNAKAADYNAIAAFIGDLSQILPLVNLVSLATDARVAEGAEAQVRLVTYSSPFPESLPELTEPLSGLSPSEQAVLSTIEGFSAPQILEPAPAPQPAAPRANPFSFD